MRAKLAPVKETVIGSCGSQLIAINFELDVVRRPFHFVQMEAFVEASALPCISHVMSFLVAIDIIFWSKMQSGTDLIRSSFFPILLSATKCKYIKLFSIT